MILKTVISRKKERIFIFREEISLFEIAKLLSKTAIIRSFDGILLLKAAIFRKKVEVLILGVAISLLKEEKFPLLVGKTLQKGWNFILFEGFFYRRL